MNAADATALHAAKAELRRRMRAARSGMTAEQRTAASAAICARLQALALHRSFARIAVFLAKSEEASVDALIADLLRRDVQLWAPRTDGALPFYTLRDLGAGVTIGTFGVREPVACDGGTWTGASEIDVALLPGLAFDASGARLGYGGGWYDRALGQASGPLTLGVCFDCQVVAQVPREAHDRGVDGVVTESRLIDVTGRLKR